MSSAEYLWVVVGDASRLPVYATDKKYQAVWWLDTRRGNTMLRLFRMKRDTRVEICIQCLLADPAQPARERGHE